MIAKLSKWLRYPLFGRTDLNRRELLLEGTIKVYGFAILTSSITAVLLFPDQLGRLGMSLVMLVGMAGLTWLARRGAMELAYRSMIGFTWLLISGVNLTFGGPLNTIVSRYFLVLVVAGLLLGVRAGGGVAVLSTIATGLILYARSEQIFPEPLFPGTEMSHGLEQIFVFIVIGLLGQLGTVSIDKAIKELKQEVKIREQAETLVRASEERLLSVVESMPVIMYALDADGLAVVWNQEGTRATGYTSEEIVSNHYAGPLLFPDPDVLEDVQQKWAQLEGDHRGWELAVGHKNGGRRIISWSSIASQFPISGWATWGIGVDVTELRQASAALQVSEDRFRILFEAESRAHHQADALQRLAIVLNAGLSPDRIQEVILEQLAEVIDYDSASVQILEEHELIVTAVAGLEEPEKILGRRFDIRKNSIGRQVMVQNESLLVADVRELDGWIEDSPELTSVRSWMCVALPGRQDMLGMITLDHHQVSYYTDQDVELVHAFANHAALALENAKLYEKVQQFVSGLEMRVTQRTAELEERFLEVDQLNQGMLNLMEDLQAAHFITSETAHDLEQANVDLAAANNELETFAYSVSHDLKAPLRAIDGYSRILQDTEKSNLSERGQYYLTTIRQATMRMTDLIQDLLAYARLERRRLSIRPVRLTPFIHSVFAEYDKLVEERGLELVVQLECETIMADHEGLKQAFRNLIENSIKFAKEDQAACITISSASTEFGCQILFSDQGIGFDMQFHDKIFEIFNRLHTDEDYPGTGIGLALVRKAMQRIGGDVRAESELGQGATFILDIPRRNQ
jgi:PAS domain S-box-containing protein